MLCVIMMKMCKKTMCPLRKRETLMLNFIFGVIVGGLVALLTVGLMFGASKSKGTDTEEKTGDNGNE